MLKLLLFFQILSIGFFVDATDSVTKDLDVITICYHNGRPGISYDDIIEHIGNGEYGSAWRDTKEKDEIQDLLSEVKENTLSMLEIIGDELIKD